MAEGLSDVYSNGDKNNANLSHYCHGIMSAMVSQITGVSIVYPTFFFKENINLRVTGLCEGNSPLTDEFHAQRASNVENASIWWHHHDILVQVH